MQPLDKQNHCRMQRYPYLHDFLFHPSRNWNGSDFKQPHSSLKSLHTTPNITPKTLTQQLRELESDGFISITVYPVEPPITEYIMTDFDQTLMLVLETLCEFGKTYVYDYLNIENEYHYN